MGPALKKRFICPAPCLQGCTKSHPVPVSFGGVRGQRGGQVGSAWRRWTCKQKSWWTRRQAGRQTTKGVIFHLSDVSLEKVKETDVEDKNYDLEMDVEK